MEPVIVLLLLAILAFFICSVLGGIAFFRLQGLRKRIDQLEHKLEASQPDPGLKTEATATVAAGLEVQAQPAEEVEDFDLDSLEEQEVARKPPPYQPPVTETPSSEQRYIPEPGRLATIFGNLKENWMIWLGGVCVGLAGIFLVRYSIETGLLGPAARVTAGVGVGIALHIITEWLYRRATEPHPSLAALAGGASITLYAALLAALHLYDLLNPTIVFGGLAVVSLFTMLIALRYGPILAIIGILGAYVVPILVSDNSGNILGALIYALLITGAAFLLNRYVYRPWLFFGTIFGSLGWWFISLTATQPDGLRGIYLAVVAYLMLAVPAFDWFLGRADNEDELPQRDPTKTFGYQLHPAQFGLLLCLAAQTVSIAHESFSSIALVSWSLLPILVIRTGILRQSMSWLPWISLCLMWFGWFFCGLDFSNTPISVKGLGSAVQKDFLIFIFGMILIYSGLGTFLRRNLPFNHRHSSLIWLAPPIWISLAYLLVTDLSIAWEWSAAAFLLGLVYLVYSNVLLIRNRTDLNGLWLILAAHFAFSLAAAMFFRQATLSLVLGVQLVSLVYLMNRFEVRGLAWVVKGVLGLVLVRLTFNPWLLNYPADLHWSFWTYGGVTLCCGAAALMVERGQQLRKWLEAGALQLFVLFLAAELRYQLYDGMIFVKEYSLLEGSINTLIWSGIGLAYYYRSKASEFLSSFYRGCSQIVSLMGLLSYLAVISILNPLWNNDTLIGSTPIANLLLLSYGAPVVMALLFYLFYDKRYKFFVAIISALSFFIFLNLEIRHLWHGGLNYYTPVLDGELYTYSVVWMVIAVIALLAGALSQSRALYNSGMGLLLVVIAKIFLIDMSDLTGLLRVASFMGLGLALLGVAYLYQRILSGVAVADEE
ncbi:MAG: DUF2339 domain-containing protein [Desulfobulbaceae bacterium]|nr:MAG: DUF2339 domain-containing protein [Desulfobulbaceae bacterium]